MELISATVYSHCDLVTEISVSHTC